MLTMLLFALAAHAQDAPVWPWFAGGGVVVGTQSNVGTALTDSLTFGSGFQHRMARSEQLFWEVDVEPLTRTETSLPLALGHWGVGWRTGLALGAVEPFVSGGAGAGVLTVLPVLGADLMGGLCFPGSAVDLDLAVRVRHLAYLGTGEEGQGYLGFTLPTAQVGLRY